MLAGSPTKSLTNVKPVMEEKPKKRFSKFVKKPVVKNESTPDLLKVEEEVEKEHVPRRNFKSGVKSKF